MIIAAVAAFVLLLLCWDEGEEESEETAILREARLEEIAEHGRITIPYRGFYL